jgi:RNA polymerase sigma-70 factor (ECF subfamily)
MVASREQADAAPVGRTPGLRELFELHGAYVWKTFRRLGVPASDLDDLTHDLFLVVQRHLGNYDPQRPVRPWLFGFAFRLASEHRRRAHRTHETASPSEDDVADPDPASLPDQRLAASEDRRLILQALDVLELGRRAVFVLYEIDGEPMNEIARSLGIPLGTAYSRLRAAREEFAAAVKRLDAARRPR